MVCWLRQNGPHYTVWKHFAYILLLVGFAVMMNVIKYSQSEQIEDYTCRPLVGQSVNVSPYPRPFSIDTTVMREDLRATLTPAKLAILQ